MSSKKQTASRPGGGKNGCGSGCCYSPCCYCPPPVYMISTQTPAAPPAAAPAAPPPPTPKKRKSVPYYCCPCDCCTSGCCRQSCCCNSPDWCVSSSNRRTGTKTECLQGYMCTYQLQQKKTTVMSDGSIRVTYINSPNVHPAIRSNHNELNRILSAKTSSTDRTGSWSSGKSGQAQVYALTHPSNSSGSEHLMKVEGIGSAELTPIQLLPKKNNSDFVIMGPSRSGSNRSIGV